MWCYSQLKKLRPNVEHQEKKIPYGRPQLHTALDEGNINFVECIA